LFIDDYRLPDLHNLHATTLLLAEVPAMTILICVL
jgi:hypothetical protein